MFVFSVLIIGYRHRHAMLPIVLDEITQSWCQPNAESVRPSNAEAQFNWFDFNLQIYEIIMKLRSIFPINFPINFFYYYLPTNLTNLTNSFVIICDYYLPTNPTNLTNLFMIIFYYYLPTNSTNQTNLFMIIRDYLCYLWEGFLVLLSSCLLLLFAHKFHEFNKFICDYLWLFVGGNHREAINKIRVFCAFREREKNLVILSSCLLIICGRKKTHLHI